MLVASRTTQYVAQMDKHIPTNVPYLSLPVMILESSSDIGENVVS